VVKQKQKTKPEPAHNAKDSDVVKVIVPKALGERFRNAVDALSGPPLRLKLSPAGVQAFDEFTSRLEREHNGGAPFPQRPERS
jgi:hypothetical protein